MRLVLRENADPQVTGVDEIGEHEIDQAIRATKGNRGFGPVRGQRIQPLALTAGQDDAQHVWWCSPHRSNLSAAASRCQGESPNSPVLTGCRSRYLAQFDGLNCPAPCRLAW